MVWKLIVVAEFVSDDALAVLTFVIKVLDSILMGVKMQRSVHRLFTAVVTKIKAAVVVVFIVAPVGTCMALLLFYVVFVALIMVAEIVRDFVVDTVFVFGTMKAIVHLFLQ